MIASLSSPALRRGLMAGLAPPSDPLRDQALKWAEAGDPEKTVVELFGYRITSDLRRGLHALAENPRVITWGGHSLSKTFGMGAGLFGHYFYAEGSVPAADGKPRGGILVLMAGKDSQIKRTSWEAIKRHAQAAAAHGHPIPGSVLPVDVGWRMDDEDPLRWAIISQPFRQPAKSSALRSVQTEAGLKHDHAIHVWMEEFDTVPAAMRETVRGWSEPGKFFGAFNPAHPSSSIQAILKSPEWAAVNFSALRCEWVLYRERVPGGVSHLQIEAEMRDPTRVRPLDVAALREDGKEPSAEAGHFRYALPAADEEDAPGPRADGVPGHPAAEPTWWAAGEMFIWQRTGLFPEASDKLIFAPSLLASCHALWRRLEPPEWAPRVVGIDAAEGGPDRFVEIAGHGRSCVDVWLRYQQALTLKVAPEKALLIAVRCPDCEGGGCERCWEGYAWPYIGRPRAVPKILDAPKMARRSLERYTSPPPVRIDHGGGGAYIIKPLCDLGCAAQGVHFGGSCDQIPGQRGYEEGGNGGYLNQRARMFGALSYAAQIGALALPPPELGPLEEELSDGFGVPEWERADRVSGVFWKLPDTEDIARALSVGSPDPMMAAGLTEGQGTERAPAESGNVGGWL